MPAALWKQFSKDEIISIVRSSTSISDLIARLGYHTRNYQTQKQVYKMLEFYNLPPFTSDDYKNKNEIEKEKICEICGKTFIVKGFGQASRKYCFECSPSTNNPTAKTRAMKKKVIEMTDSTSTAKTNKVTEDKVIKTQKQLDSFLGIL